MLKVGVWGPGSMGVIALRGVIDHPELQLTDLVVFVVQRNGHGVPVQEPVLRREREDNVDGVLHVLYLTTLHIEYTWRPNLDEEGTLISAGHSPPPPEMSAQRHSHGP